MCLKIVKTHTAATRELAMHIAQDLRDKCIPCSDPQIACAGTGKESVYHVDQYVRTVYPEI